MDEKKAERRGLGRGLSALMADVDVAHGGVERARGDRVVPVERVEPNPDQPRRDFTDAAMQDLARSVAEKGIIQPLIVRVNPRDPEGFEIVAGERRWRAAQMAQLHEVPVLVRELNDTEVLELAIIENIQRADLNPVEEAMGYRQLMDRFGHTQEKLAEALGKSRSHIANLLRLLQLPEEVLQHLRKGALSAGHARALITTDDPAGLARQVIAKGLSVRQTEQLAKAESTPKPQKKPKSGSGPDADTLELQQQLSANLRMAVRIDHPEGGQSGRLILNYNTLEELDALCGILGSTPLDVTR